MVSTKPNNNLTIKYPENTYEISQLSTTMAAKRVMTMMMHAIYKRCTFFIYSYTLEFNVDRSVRTRSFFHA